MADQTVTDALDTIDSLQQKLAQLEAMLTMSFGISGDAFRSMNDVLQDNYLWACSTMALEAKQLAERIATLSSGRAQLKPAHA